MIHPSSLIRANLKETGEDPSEWIWIDFSEASKQAFLAFRGKVGNELAFQVRGDLAREVIEPFRKGLLDLGIPLGDLRVFVRTRNLDRPVYALLVRATDNNATTVKMLGYDVQTAL
jgi:hypothetical protein